jgi:hypothetical protein
MMCAYCLFGRMSGASAGTRWRASGLVPSVARMPTKSGSSRRPYENPFT